MVQQSTALVGYHTAPHIDMFETGDSAARMLLDVLKGHLSPKVALVRLPLIAAAENARHDEGPLSEVIDAALEMEKRGDILHGGIYAVQPWLDTEDMASSVLVVADGDREIAQTHADGLARAFWARRSAFVPDLVAPDEAVRQSLTRRGGTVVLADPADAPSSGSTGDSTVLLKACLDASLTDELILLNIVDPKAVGTAINAGVGARVSVRVGGKIAPSFYSPVMFSGYVKTISDGVFRFKGPGMRGVQHQMGRTVVLVRGGIHLVVMERPVTQWDPQLYRSPGEEPADARAVQVKSPAGFRAGYADIVDEVMIIKSPGIATSQLSSLPWRHLRRPIYPLDPEVSFP
jgi:microcystin degradation protein MlrC